MGLKYLLDTDVVSQLGHDRGDPRAIRRMTAEEESLAVSAPTLFELVYGLERLPVTSPRRAKVARFIDDLVAGGLPVLPYDDQAAVWHGRERVRLQAEGIALSTIDGQIAAVASINRLILVTGNVKHFRHLQGLAVQNWFD